MGVDFFGSFEQKAQMKTKFRREKILKRVGIRY